MSAGAILGTIAGGALSGLQSSPIMNAFRQMEVDFGIGSALSPEQTALNEFNASEAQKQRDYEKMMSDTAYSRAVADMKSAGLNPYLMYGSGQQASATSGASAHSTAVSQGKADFLSGASMMANAILKSQELTARQQYYDTLEDKFQRDTTVAMARNDIDRMRANTYAENSHMRNVFQMEREFNRKK